MAFGQDTVATDVAALKVYYSKNQYLNSTILRVNQFLGLCPKDPDFAGSYMPVPIMSSGSPGISTDFTIAYNNQEAGVYEAFKVPATAIYNLASVSNQLIQASRNDVGGFKSLMKAQTDASMWQTSNYIAAYMFRDGTGTLGTLDATTFATNPGPKVGVLTFTNQTDAQFFFKGLRLTASPDGITPRASMVYVTQVNVPLGQITVSSIAGGPALDMTTTDWQPGDGVQLQGTFNKVPPGLQKWIPCSKATYPGAGQPANINNLLGVDRSVDSASYAGTFFDGSTMKIKDAFVRGLSQIMNNGGSATLIICNPMSLAQLDLELLSQYQYTKVEGPTGVSFMALTLNTPFGPIPVLSDRNCPPRQSWALDMAQVELFSMGQCPSFMKSGTSDDVFHYQDKDAVQIRVGTYWGFCVKKPRSCGAIALSA